MWPRCCINCILNCTTIRITVFGSVTCLSPVLVQLLSHGDRPHQVEHCPIASTLVWNQSMSPRSGHHFAGFTPTLAVVFIGAVATPRALSHAGDWPQILGPTRNGVAVNETLVDSLPRNGAPILWEHPVGEGYAGAAIADGKTIVYHRVDNKEVVEALDALSGKPIWKQAFPATYQGGINPDRGPRCVPLIHKGNVYVFGADGDLHSVDLKEGGKRWSRSLGTDYQPPPSFFGVGST